MNRINLIGRWAKDIELKYLNDGTAVANSTLAVDDGYGDKKKTYFLTVNMWKKTAEATAQYSGKGKRVAIDGKITQRSWEKDGKKTFVIEVVAEQVEFLEMKERESDQSDPFVGEGTPIDISEEDLPF